MMELMYLLFIVNRPPPVPSPPSVSSNGSGSGCSNGSGSGGSSGSAPRAGTREVHNKLEKNRRAHLKECFELLKRQLPATPDDKKTSNLSILGSAIRYIQVSINLTTLCNSVFLVVNAFETNVDGLRASPVCLLTSLNRSKLYLQINILLKLINQCSQYFV